MLATGSDLSQQMSQAWDAFNKEQWEQAESLAKEALAHDNQCAEANCVLGLIFQRQRRFPVAIDHLLQAVQLDGSNPKYLRHLGTVYHECRELEKAEQYLTQAIDVCADCPADWHNQLGLILGEQKKSAEALAAFRRALELEPHFAEVYNNMGVTHVHGKNIDEAIRCYRQALEKRPDYPEAHNNLGNVTRHLGRFREAEAHFREALKLRPNHPEVLNNLALNFMDQEQFERAVECLREAIRQRPNYPEAQNNLGLILEKQGKLDEAIACFKRALEDKPQSHEILCNLGVVLVNLNRADEAIECYQKALAANPKAAITHNNLGNAYKTKGLEEEAIASFREAIRLDPDYSDAYNNLGNSLRNLGELEASIEHFEKALAIKPDSAEAYNNMAIAYANMRQPDQALRYYEMALRIKPDYVEARMNRSLGWLVQGELAKGWLEYEWRWKLKDVSPRVSDRPTWDGSSLTGKTILLYSEQGLGDTIQFIRYAALVKRLGARVILECPQALVQLLRNCAGIDVLLHKGAAVPPYDFQVPLMSLPRILKTTLDDVPAEVPYLFPEPQLVAHWKKVLDDDASFKVGICWQGSKQYGGDRHRSIPLRYFSPLAKIPGVRLYSLQKGYGTEQLPEVAKQFSVIDLGGKLDEVNGAFVDTAAVMKNLDLIVSSDTAIVHLAGALGVPVWMATPTACDWRWLQDREDNPWYPTLRLFRQHDRGGWPEVMDRIRVEVGKLLANKSGWKPTSEEIRLAEEVNGKAVEHMKKREFEQAVAAFREALRLHPDSYQIKNNLGVGLAELKQYDEAVRVFEEIVQFKPEFLDAINNLGLTYLNLSRLEEAERQFRRFLVLKPGNPDAYNNLGVSLVKQGKVTEALDAYDQAIALRPGFADAHANRSRALLQFGDFKEGWTEYEWRWKSSQGGTRPTRATLWCGQPLNGETILLHAEQGLGDTMQFLRYAAIIQEMGGNVLVDCPPKLVPILSTCPAVAGVHGHGRPLPKFRWHAPLMSLPGIVGTTLETVPAKIPYLHADEGLVRLWKERIGTDGFKIGICWQGNPDYQGDHLRSIPLKHFQALASLPNVRLFSLQKGPGEEQIDDFRRASALTAWDVPWDEEAGAFMDSAAIIKNMDLIVSSDTSIAHLAGALGAPVWLVLPRVAEFRWLLDRDDSPWYPTMRLFRCEPGETWDAVFERVRKRIEEQLASQVAITVEVAPGELVDKITILEIKAERITDEAKLANVRTELKLLREVLDRRVPRRAELARLKDELKGINETLWDIEDRIRACKRAKDFGATFIELARSVYRTNDRRCQVKRAINEMLSARFLEEKSYENYD